jgi:filamentous hemagglutinin family protein
MKRSQSIVGLVLLTSIGFPKGAIAQVAQDSTVGTSVNPAGNLFTITGGTRSGNNLFHSFSQFSVPTNGSAIFNNATDIQNIFSRVTGSSVSNIDGLIKANGNASLFLMNPNGIVLGPKATLNIGGSFIGTTANSIKFKDGLEFSARNLTATPLLSVKVPIGLQMGTNPAPIAVQNSFLEVSSGQTLGFVGGDIQMQGGRLIAPSGRIELGSLTQSGTVAIDSNSWTTNYAGLTQFGAIDLSQGAYLYFGGDGAGSLNLQAKTLTLRDGSVIYAATTGSNNGGKITLTTSDRIDILDDNNTGTEIYSLVTPTATGRGADIAITTGILNIQNPNAGISNGTNGSGSGGNITIDAKRVVVDQAAYLAVYTSNSGKSGDLVIRATDSVKMQSNPSRGGLSAHSYSNQAVSAGNIIIKTDRLTLDQFGQISSLSFPGAGDGGIIDLQAKTIELFNESSVLSGTFSTANSGKINISADRLILDRYSNIVSSTYGESAGSGNAGQIDVKTRTLEMSNGAYMATDTFGPGNGGRLNIRATESISMIGRYTDGQPTTLVAGTNNNSSGNSGTLSVTTPKLLMKESNIQAFVGGSGNSGNIFIKADTIDAIKSTIVAANDSDRANDPGQLDIVTRQLNLDQSEITTQTYGLGDASPITIRSETIDLVNKSTITANTTSDGNAGQIGINANRLRLQDSRILSQSYGKGNAGEVTLKVDELSLVKRSAIDSSTFELGNAGTVTINAANTVLENSRIRSQSSGTGNGGQIKLTSGKLTLRDGSRLSTEALQQGNAGNLTIQGDDIRVLQRSQITSRSTGTGKGGTIEIAARSLFLNQNAQINASTVSSDGGNLKLTVTDVVQLRDRSLLNAEAGGTGNGGNIILNAGFVYGIGNSDIIANARRGNGGKVNVTTNSIFGLAYRNRLTPDNDITASSEFGLNGSVQLTTLNINPANVLNSLPADVARSSQLSDRCASARTGSFVSTGRGGIPQTPIQRIKTNRSWHDLRSTVATTSTPIQPIATVPPMTQLVEASAIQVDETGTISLIAPQSIPPNPATCATSMTHP